MKYAMLSLAFHCLTFVALSQQPGVDSNTVALWHCNEGVGNILNDASQNHNTGEIHNCAWIGGKFGSALKFNGLTSYVILPNSPSLRPANGFTLEAWVSLDEHFVQDLPFGHDVQFAIIDNLGPYPAGGGYTLFINHDSHSLMFAYRTHNQMSRFSHGVDYPHDSAFHHVAVTYDALNPTNVIVKLFLDGAMGDSVSLDDNIQYDNTPYFYIGSNRDGQALGGPGVREFPGIIDEVRISNIARQPAEFGFGGLAIDRSSLDFGLVRNGGSLSQNISLGNTMFEQTIHIDSIISSDPHFAVTTSSFDLPPASSQNLAVTYTPTATQTDTGTLTIYATGSSALSASVHMTGTGFDLGLAPVISSVKDVANDDGKQVRVIWYQSVADDPSADDRVTQYSIWRRVDEAGQKAIENFASMSLRPGIQNRVMVDGTLWDFIVTVPAVQFEKYSYVAPTLRNANPQSFNWATYRVAAHTANGSFYFSEQDSGYSLDNVVPPPPIGLVAHHIAGTIALGWDAAPAPDLEHYNVYRSNSPNVVPSVFLRIGSSRSTAFVDSQLVKDSTYYYSVTSVDSSGNESAQSNVTPPQFVTQVLEGTGEIPTSFMLRQNYPNPFNPSTRIVYGIPVQSRVTVAVFDLLGREVAVLVNGEVRGPGMYDVRWHPTVSSGVYFYRIRATSMDERSSFSQTRKMVIMK